MRNAKGPGGEAGPPRPSPGAGRCHPPRGCGHPRVGDPGPFAPFFLTPARRGGAGGRAPHAPGTPARRWPSRGPPGCPRCPPG